MFLSNSEKVEVSHSYDKLSEGTLCTFTYVEIEIHFPTRCTGKSVLAVSINNFEIDVKRNRKM